MMRSFLSFARADPCSPGGLVTLKTLLEASRPDQQIEAYLFEAYVTGSLLAWRC